MVETSGPTMLGSGLAAGPLSSKNTTEGSFPGPYGSGNGLLFYPPSGAGFCSFQAERILAPGLRKWGTAHRTDGSRLLYAALSAQDSLLESDFTTEPFGREKAIDNLSQIAQSSRQVWRRR